MNKPCAKLIIRDAEPADAVAITSLLTELGYPQSTDEVKDRIKRMSKRMKDRLLVAVQDMEVAGMLILHIIPMFHHGGNICRITSLVVGQEQRNKYIGQRLMEMAEAYAKANSCGKMEITSQARRTDAHAFYKKLGYDEKQKRFVKPL